MKELFLLKLGEIVLKGQNRRVFEDKLNTVARRIGTLETSILPYEDCCTVFTPKHPKTKPVLAQVEAEEQKLDVEGLIARAIANTEKTQIRYYEDEQQR